MSLDIKNIHHLGTVNENPKSEQYKHPAADATSVSHTSELHDRERPISDEELKHLLELSGVQAKRLKFSINRELDTVVVKVVDADTDKVIKEIPPEELQKLHARIKEAIGLFIDEKI